ncbi:glycosyltransferase family 9 protein, partial [Streptococcus pneumoniae]|uniref:hypothetical protein n=1 Tax=Streptococcus pneumoniae TaxID=1313 RepID=UPI00139F7EF4
MDLEGFSRVTAVLGFASGASRRVGLHAFHGAGSYRGDLLTHRLAANPIQHAGDAFSDLVDALGADPSLL